MKAHRITEYDLHVTAPAGQGRSLTSFIKALRQAGLKAWKLDTRAYQVSFAEQPELRAALPPIGTEYDIPSA